MPKEQTPWAAAGLSFPRWLQQVASERGEEVRQACALARSYFTQPMPHVGGSDIGARMANRLGCGYDVERAAAREYLYRWGLALQSRVFGAPHTLGL